MSESRDLFAAAAAASVDQLCPYCKRHYERDCLCGDATACARWLRWLMRERHHGAPCPADLVPQDTALPPVTHPTTHRTVTNAR